ncbi:TPA: hypothetical protein IHL91_002035 [Escherichia coli]|nr:hypothetical protein [Escherichia coli]HAO2832146.1 hypothetical protein [Escherichia coli]
MTIKAYILINVFPAPAGINRTDSEAELQAEGVPRASGDKPWLWLCFLL